MKSVRNTADVRRIARRRIPKVAFDFIEGGAEDEVTLARNEEAYRELALRPRWLQDVSSRDQSTTVFGQRIETPVLLAPVGLARLAHQEAEVAAARAAVSRGTIFTLSSNASMSIERVAEAAPGPHWFQIYLWRRRERNEELLERVRRNGYSALVVTVDVPVVAKRERDLANGFTVPFRPTLGMALDVARRPRWARGLLAGGPITFANYTEFGAGSAPTELWKYVNSDLINPAATYADLRWLRESWEGPLLVKGVLTAEDAEQAIACGVDGLVVSNHGARQTDGVPATIDVLPEIVAATAGRAEILVDSGIRRGSDVVKALALGARAVLIGRPYVYGAAMAGEAGVSRVLEILSDEIDRTLALIGRPTLAHLDPTCVTRLRPDGSGTADALAPGGSATDRG
jgi:isopentenyl diphosphate isomerase/L-lactate dehydrogenase-like FMN-dependent dehydrogenase